MLYDIFLVEVGLIDSPFFCFLIALLTLQFSMQLGDSTVDKNLDWVPRQSPFGIW